MVVCVFFGTFARTDTPGDIVGGTNPMTYFSSFIDIEGMKWPIAGGGGVTLRKVQNLLPYEAVIEVVFPDMCSGLDVLTQDNVYADVLKLTRKGFGNRGLDGADFAIAVTSELSLSSRISALCHSKRIPVNMVDVKEKCSFVFPPIAWGGPVVVGISIDGMNPIIARCLKARIQSAMPDSLGNLIARLEPYGETVEGLFPDSPQACSVLFYELVEEGLSHNGCPAQEQAQIIIDRKPEQEHE